MDWYEIIGIVLVPLICFLTGYFTGKRRSIEDDGIVIINEKKCEVIFRDPYDRLIKKRYVNLKIET